MKKLLLCILLICQLAAYAQNDTIRNLVFEGAGIRGIAYSGVIKQLEKQDVLKGVTRVGGTSSGAITALLLSLGYTADEITGIVYNTPYKKFNDGRYFFLLVVLTAFKNTMAGTAAGSSRTGFQN